MMKNTFFNHKIRIEIKVTATTAISFDEKKIDKK